MNASSHLSFSVYLVPGEERAHGVGKLFTSRAVARLPLPRSGDSRSE
jgi:hypothetical protein